MPLVYYNVDTLRAMLVTLYYSLSIDRIKLAITKLL